VRYNRTENQDLRLRRRLFRFSRGWLFVFGFIELKLVVFKKIFEKRIFVIEPECFGTK